ncbi:MAG TPA: bifunctional riboflavin kinase/FAD synthetase [Spirochaetota bacterium]|nr:bifunctional riboflavin kinase/FAD synthetase [Spirochaetota bacterium]
MSIFRDIPEGAFTSPVLTIGSFDGVHVGHHRIVSALLNEARQTSGDAVVLTFTAHPRKVITPETPPRILTTTDEKVRALGALGVSNIILLDFTREMASMSAAEFINDIVLKKMGVVHIVVGYDHAFGKDREGTFEFLRELSHRRGFGVTRVEPRNFYSRPISSTWIRAELEDGGIAAAAALLGRNYTLSGEVTRGAGRGRTLGFPTANVVPSDRDKVVPKDGVYAVRVMIGRSRPAKGMLNIGTNPTFANTERTIEVNIFDLDEDLVGAELELEFVRRLRDEVKFASVDELVAQIRRDREDALAALGEC